LENQQSGAEQREIRIPIPQVTAAATYVLLGLIAVVFLAEVYVQQPDGSNTVLSWGAVSLASVRAGDYYRLLTAMFLHASPAHIFFNGYALYAVGVSVERFFGHFRFLAVYFLGGLAGGIVSIALTNDPQSFSVGASGAIFAIFGAEIVFLYVNRQIFAASAQQYLRRLIILAVLNFAIDLYTNVGASAVRIDIWAHFGGFVGGILLAWLMGPHYTGEQDSFAIGGFRVIDRMSGMRILTVTAAFAVSTVGLLLLTLALRGTAV
jgi:rhomboid protease GluP